MALFSGNTQVLSEEGAECLQFTLKWFREKVCEYIQETRRS